MDLYCVQQSLVTAPLADIRSEVFGQLSGLGLRVPAGEVAIPVGSRGISNIPEIIRSCGDWLREQGASPFIVPAMGSHNGATAAGQRSMVESLGVTGGMERHGGFNFTRRRVKTPCPCVINRGKDLKSPTFSREVTTRSKSQKSPQITEILLISRALLGNKTLKRPQIAH